MKKMFLLIIASAMMAMGADAQILWRVSGNGAKGESYLFGTHHIAPLSVLDSIKGFKPALGSVEAVYGEMEMPEDPNSPQVAMLTLKYAQAPADSTLNLVLRPEQIDSLDKVLAAYSGGALSSAQLNAFKPSMVATQLAMMQSLKIFPGFNPAEQLDTRIQQMATAAGIPVKGLETMEQQLEILMGAPVADQARDLMETVRKDGESADKAKKMAEYYLNGDLAGLEKLLMEDADFDPEDPMYKRLIDNRNNAWMTSIKEILPQQKVMIAVGAGHLIGDNGLLSQLRKAGYEVTPVE